MAEAASTLIESLDQAQRNIACKPFADEGERRRWFYVPTDHGGLPLAAMSATQHRNTHRLVATGLSPAGYTTVGAIIGLENILDSVEGWRNYFGRDRGRDPLLYYITIFGNPGGEAPWGWRFGGHHISLHYTIASGKVVASAPCFLGADPADTPLLGPHLHRPLAAVEDLGRELFHALGQEKLGRAVLSPVPPADLVGGNRSQLTPGDRPKAMNQLWRREPEGELRRRLAEIDREAEARLGLKEEYLEALSFTAGPKGIPAADLSDDEAAILRALIDCYLNRLPDDVADEQAALVEREFDKLAFLWAGGGERYEPHYYRIQGERILIEYDNTQRGANHIHTVWRDLANDFAGDVLARHYAEVDH
jgi:hypothetical protein